MSSPLYVFIMVMKGKENLSKLQLRIQVTRRNMSIRFKFQLIINRRVKPNWFWKMQNNCGTWNVMLPIETVI
jgi:hypothetical protein